MRAAAIYARISSDPAGTRLGVERQIGDCEALAVRKGWPVVGRYVDNDTSAWSGRLRLEYRRLLEDIKDRAVDGVLVWQLDRLHRHPRELEESFDVVAAAGIAENLATVTGEYDLSTGEGRLMARIVGAVARKESDDKSLRLRRKHAELAARGRLAGGGPRPFGFEDDRLTPRPGEAAVVREIAARVLAGDSLRSVCVDLGSRGVRTTKGNDWEPSGLKRLLMSARISGRREYGGEMFPAVWPAIIPPEQSDRLRCLLGSRTLSSGRAPRRYLLTGGLLRCGRCGVPMVARPTAQRVRRYVCAKGPGLGGCGRIAANAEPVEHLVAEAVLLRLDTPEMAAALAESHAQQAELADLHDRVAQDQTMLEELAADYANRKITHREWLAARDPIQTRIDQNRSRLSRLSPTTAVDEYAGRSDLLRTAWQGLPLSRQQAVVRVILDHVVVHPAKPGRGFNPDRFTPVWRL
ncbi:MAG: recombinase family protein [Actinomycetota bacterium]